MSSRFDRRLRPERGSDDPSGRREAVWTLLVRRHERLRATETAREANARINENETVLADPSDGAPRVLRHERIDHVSGVPASVDRVGDEPVENTSPRRVG